MKFLPEGFLLNTQENISAISSLDGLRRACANGTVVEAIAGQCDTEHNLHVDFGFIKGIIPREKCALGIKDGSVKDIAIIARVNKPVKFIVDEITEVDGEPVAFLDRVTVQESYMADYLKTLTVGDIIDARVTHLESFGAFCDIGCGFSALLPIDHISVSRIPHPNARLKPGDDIKVVVKTIDEQGRITLTLKELLGTWEENAANFTVGETVSGIVRSVEPYGIFIELAPNLAGLAEHIPGISVGQQASVYIKSIIPEKMKIKLVIVDAFDANYPPKPQKYYYTGDHMDYFCYSPENSEKVVETIF